MVPLLQLGQLVNNDVFKVVLGLLDQLHINQNVPFLDRSLVLPYLNGL